MRRRPAAAIKEAHGASQPVLRKPLMLRRPAVAMNEDSANNPVERVMTQIRTLAKKAWLPETMEEVRALGHYPKRNRNGKTDDYLALKVARTLQEGQFSAEQNAELEAMQHLGDHDLPERLTQIVK